MKAGHISTEELSAFADGRARRPARVEAHLAACPACARRLAELHAMSAALHDLPSPEPRPHFAVNVQARVEQSGARGEWRGRRALPVMAGLLVAAMLAITLLLTPLLRGDLAPAPVPATSIAYDLRWHDDTEVVVALAVLLDEGIETGMLESGMVAEDAYYEEDSALHVMEVLLATLWPVDAEGPWVEEPAMLPDELDFSGFHDVGPWLEWREEEG